jgi:hypothetical protein
MSHLRSHYYKYQDNWSGCFRIVEVTVSCMTGIIVIVEESDREIQIYTTLQVLDILSVYATMDNISTTDTRTELVHSKL